MLIAWSIENYRSFRERVTVSMVAAELRSRPAELDANNVFQVRDTLKLLTSAAIYGANASGKSNLIAAMLFMRQFVLNSSRDTRIHDPIDVQPFLLNSATENAPSRFEIVFVLAGIIYRYGFLANQKHIEQEWLFQTIDTKEGYLFERTLQNIKINRRTFREANGLEERTRPNALFLSVAAQWNSEIAIAISKWFEDLLIDTGVDTARAPQIAQRFLESAHQEDMSEFVHRLDLGISNIQLDTKTGTEFTSEPALGRRYRLRKQPDGSQERVFLPETPVINTIHAKYDQDGNLIGEVGFQIDTHESQGTRRLFSLAEPILHALRVGGILVIDELDARLHPLMTSAIIKLFNQHTTNPKHAQLIFTTHDTNLLGVDLFRRDQIWFVEKSTQGESILYALVEYRVRNDASYEKNYIQGRYGAIPFIGDLIGLIGEAHAETNVTNP